MAPSVAPASRVDQISAQRKVTGVQHFAFHVLYILFYISQRGSPVEKVRNWLTDQSFTSSWNSLHLMKRDKSSNGALQTGADFIKAFVFRSLMFAQKFGWQEPSISSLTGAKCYPIM